MEMRKIGKLAVAGSGPSALYLLKHVLDGIGCLRGSLASIVVFEKSALAGYGMPFHPATADRYNRANISSEELPELPETLADWLKQRDAKELAGWGIERAEISESGVYCRLALGRYFHDQFNRIVGQLRAGGVSVELRTSCAVEDLTDSPADGRVSVRAGDGATEDFDTVVIATGHCWEDDDKPNEGYYSSPWPIFKLLPDADRLLNHAVGTLGASLSAFDVISSLSNRHGRFVRGEAGLSYQPFEGTEEFEVVMHAADGWLPHLQWDQVEPLREIYRHVSRDELLSLRGDGGYLRLECFFDRVCRPALIQAFEKDGIQEVAELLRDDSFGIGAFVDEMSERHEYVDSFEGMRDELEVARDSVENHRPIHWKEILDDLMYCLNYHAELLPAEDHVLFRKTVMPFLMNVIAAMPLQSATMLLALHDAGKVRLVAGMVTIVGKGDAPGTTRVSVESESGPEETEYRMFVDCSGEKPMELDDFPFRSLAQSGAIREARAAFLDQQSAEEVDPETLLVEDGVTRLRTGGVDIDAAFRLIGEDGVANPRIHDLSFPHTSGVRPYSYGLQACNATAGIVVKTWLEAVRLELPRPVIPLRPHR